MSLRQHCYRLSAILCMLVWSMPVFASDFRGFLTVFVGFPTIIFCNILVWLLFSYRSAGFGKVWSRWLMALWLLALPALSYFGFMMWVFGHDEHALALLLALLAIIAIVLTLMFCLVYSPLAVARRDYLALVTSWGDLGLSVLLTGLLAFDFAALLGKEAATWPLIVVYLLLFGMVVRCHMLVVRTYRQD